METEDVHNNENGNNLELVGSPFPAKKLKQVRLPFKALDPKSSQTAISSEAHLPANQKKRRFSDKDAYFRPAKSPKTSLDSEQENKSNLFAENINKLNKKPICKSVNNFKVTDDEISSSCESDIQIITEKNFSNKKCNKSCNILENFVKKEHPQVPEVSTSSEFVDNPIVNTQCHVENKLKDSEPVLCKSFNEEADATNNGDRSSEEEKIESQNELKSTKIDSAASENRSIADSELNTQVDHEFPKAKSENKMGTGENCDEVCISPDFDAQRASDANSKENHDVGQSQSSDDDEASITVTSIELDSSIAEEKQSDSDEINLSISSTSKPITASAKKRKAQRQDERERLKQEKLKKMQEMKAEKMKQKELLNQKREKAKAEKEEKKKKILEMKMDEKRKKDEDKQKKEEDRKKREDERKTKEDEKKAKDEERRQIEEIMNKKKEKVKMQFANFFVKKSTSTDKDDQSIDTDAGQFKPFQLTKEMHLAPITRSVLEDIFKFDDMFITQNHFPLYIEELKSGKHIPKIGERTCPPPEEKFDDDVEMLDEITDDTNFVADVKVKLNLPRAKLLQFHENQRPPYWGTYRKFSKEIRPRNPFGQDKVLLDYEVDSDDEWEEEEPGESLHGSDDDKESEDDYDEDGEFMVPHGYLSADEEDEDPETANNPETQKQKLKLRAEEFEMDLKRNSQKHVKKPRIIGCVFMMSFNMSEELKNNDRVKFFQSYESVLLDNRPIISSFTMMLTHPQTTESNDTSSVKNSPEDNAVKSKTPTSLKKPFPEEGMPFLIKLVHANSNSRPNLVTEFKEFWKQHCSYRIEDAPADSENASPTPSCELSKRQIDLTIQKISSWCRYTNPEIYNRLCWVVSDEYIKKYNIDNLPVPNKWNYVTKVLSMRAAANADQVSITPVNNTPKVNRITKFVQPMCPQALNLIELPSKSSNEKTPNITKMDKFVQHIFPNSNVAKTTVNNIPKDMFTESERTPKSSKTLGPMLKFLKPTVSASKVVESNKDEVEVLAVYPQVSVDDVEKQGISPKSIDSVK